MVEAYRWRTYLLDMGATKIRIHEDHFAEPICPHCGRDI
jgi:hypothetical protein